MRWFERRKLAVDKCRPGEMAGSGGQAALQQLAPSIEKNESHRFETLRQGAPVLCLQCRARDDSPGTIPYRILYHPPDSPQPGLAHPVIERQSLPHPLHILGRM